MVALRVEYDAGVVALSAAIGFIGAYGATSTCEQFRLASVNSHNARKLYTWIWLVACSFGGVCIWGMHFVGMSSFRLMLGDEEIPLRYNLANAIMLLAITLFMTFVAVIISITDDCFNRSTKEIMEKFIARATTNYTLQEIRQLGQMRILYIVFTHSIERPVIGGIISGVAVGLMHYIGMMGMEFQGSITYDPGIVVASCVTSILVILGGFWIFFRVLSLFPSLDILRIVCSCNGMFGISGLHYIGLQAATFNYDPQASPPDPRSTVDRYTMLIGVLLASSIYTLIILVYVISDLRAWLFQTSAQLHSADTTLASIQKLATGTYAHIARDTQRYQRKYMGHTAVLALTEDESACQLRALYNDIDDDDNSSSHSRSSEEPFIDNNNNNGRKNIINARQGSGKRVTVRSTHSQPSTVSMGRTNSDSEEPDLEAACQPPAAAYLSRIKPVLVSAGSSGRLSPCVVPEELLQFPSDEKQDDQFF